MITDYRAVGLSQAVRALAERLRHSGKAPTAEYYDGVVGQIEGARTPDQVLDIARELASSARIVELANFDREDERAFDAMYAEAKLLLR